MPRAFAGYASAAAGPAAHPDAHPGAGPVARPAGPAGTAVLAALGLGAALAVRVELAGPAGARSATAGLVFGGLLVAVSLSLAGLRRPAPARLATGVAAGLAGAAVLCLPVLAIRAAPAGALGLRGFPAWAAVVVLVAVSEEALLRGVLFRAVAQWRGTSMALAATTLAFGFVHVPLYGWRALPVDLAAGWWLGCLRVATGGVSAPAVAHAVADLAGWWLV